MSSYAQSSAFSSGDRAAPHDISLPGTQPTHGRLMAVLGLTAVIFLIDISWQKTNCSVLYVVPLLMLAHGGETRHLGRIVALMVVLTYSAYQIKKMIDPRGMATTYFHFTLLNRTFVVLMLGATAWVMRLWVRWREERLEPEPMEDQQYRDREIGETLAMACCVPLVVVLGIVDILAPANYNLAILYPVPLLICVWARSRALLWATLAVLLALAGIALWVGPPPTDPEAIQSLARNRVLAVVALVAVTFILHGWMGRERDSA